MSEIRVSIGEYLDLCKNVRRLSEHTVRAYKVDLEAFCQMLMPIRNLDDLQAADIERVLESIAGRRAYSPLSIRRRIASIRGYLRRTKPELAGFVFGRWRLELKLPRKLPRSIDKFELRKLLDPVSWGNLELLTTKLCILLLIATGMRVSELCALRCRDVRLSTGEIRVRGKGNRERIVLVANNEILAELRAHIEATEAYGSHDHPLFSNMWGKPLTPQCLRLRIHRIARKVGTSAPITPHMFRHTAATLLIEAGVDIRFVQRLLGHASISTTERYTHVSNQALYGVLRRADVIATIGPLL